MARLTWMPLVALALAAPRPAAAQNALAGAPIHITRASGPITIDGVLDDDAWSTATRVEKWYETNPGDNIEPRVANVGLLTFDDRFFYAAFEFSDPDPKGIRAPLGDRDNVPGFTDYGGVIVDTRGDGHSAMMFLANARGIQYDAITDDAAGEDSSPDFFWDSATRITEHGWTLELRIPFSSMRYRDANPQTWGILLYRNMPRDFRYQIFSAPLPRGSNCFVCRANALTGLERLPSGGHVVAAPYTTATKIARPADGPGTPLVAESIDPEVGLDVKWTPNADTVVDLTANPDFSQVEADTAQISANERFALFFPEKRPFFLESVDLLSTPLQAVYTRTITAPSVGGRVTGLAAGVRYTVLVTQDDGGGSVIIPGANSSSIADQPSGSTVFIARAKRNLGLSFVSLLATDREGRDGSDYNRVVGPDFQWRPTSNDAITGQLIFSDTRTPNRPDLAPEWTGQRRSSHAGLLQWARDGVHYDYLVSYKDLGDAFRADIGFIPQVGYREGLGQAGLVFRPMDSLVSLVRPFFDSKQQDDRDGNLITRLYESGVNMNTILSGFTLFSYIDDRVRSGEDLFRRRRFNYVARLSPSRQIAQIALDGSTGEEIDFANSRLGHGTTINLSARLNPMNHLELEILEDHQWLNVLDDQRLFSARVSRLRGVYTFTPRMFVRLIAQYVSTERDPSLYVEPVPGQSAVFSGSALFAYKLNWQSVLFVGYGDDRDRVDVNRLEPSSRQFFVKLSYAFQR